VKQDPIQLEFIRMLKDSIVEKLKPLIEKRDQREKKQRVKRQEESVTPDELEAVGQKLLQDEADLEQSEGSPSNDRNVGDSSSDGETIKKENLGARINAGWAVLRKAENHILTAMPDAMTLLNCEQWQKLIDIAQAHEQQLNSKLCEQEILQKRMEVAEEFKKAMAGQERETYTLKDTKTGGAHGRTLMNIHI